MRYLFICFTLLLALPVHAACTNRGCSDELGVSTTKPPVVEQALGWPPKPSVGEQTLERVDSFGGWASNALEQLATKLGTTVEYLWPTFVRQVVIKNAADISRGVFYFVLAALFFIVFTKLRDTANRLIEQGEVFDVGFAQALSGTLSFFRWTLLIVFLIWGSSNIFDGVVGMLAPEPEALQNLIHAIKGLKGL